MRSRISTNRTPWAFIVLGAGELRTFGSHLEEELGRESRDGTSEEEKAVQGGEDRDGQRHMEKEERERERVSTGASWN